MIRTGLLLGVAGALLLAAGPLGTRAGLWPFLVGFLLVALSLVLGLAGGSVCLAGGLRSGQWGMALAGIGLCVAVAGVPSAAILAARGTPPINDITTDPDDPPPFEAVVPLRAGGNTAEYGGAEVAAQQRRAYPDIEPVVLPLAPEAAFARVLGVIRERGWTVAASDASSGRIEAVDTTFWFGFEDDVVVRLRPAEGGTRVDVRSSSRVGIGDMGTNARRVRALIGRVRETAGTSDQ
jgi:uncharacterized protein (DUF1499 family)